MKLIFNNNKIIIYLNKKLILDNSKLDTYFKNLFLKLKDKYNTKIVGYYNINVYTDKTYGSIIEMENQDLDYYNYFDQVDMEIKIIKNDFLYQIDYDYVTKDILNKTVLYKFDGKLYLKILDDIILNKILECSKVIYGQELKKIYRNSEKVKV